MRHVRRADDDLSRHLLIVLLVPEKRGARNVPAAVAMAVPYLFPGFIRFNSSLAIAIVFSATVLVFHLEQIGWDTVRDDARHPMRTVRMMLGVERAPDQATQPPKPSHPAAQPPSDPATQQTQRPSDPATQCEPFFRRPAPSWAGAQ